MDAHGRSAGGRREEVLRLVRDAREPVSIAEVAVRLGIHQNTARFHLDTLVDHGQVERAETTRRSPGRPPLFFRAVRAMDPDGPRHYLLLAEVLADTLANDPDPHGRAIAAGRAWGRRHAASAAHSDDPIRHRADGSAGDHADGSARDRADGPAGDRGNRPVGEPVRDHGDGPVEDRGEGPIGDPASDHGDGSVAGRDDGPVGEPAGDYGGRSVGDRDEGPVGDPVGNRGDEPVGDLGDEPVEGRGDGSVGESADRLVLLLDALGFAPERGDRGRIGLRNCPFLELAAGRPQIVCPIHLGLMQGAMSAWGSPVTVDRLDPFVEPDLCVAHLTREGVR